MQSPEDYIDYLILHGAVEVSGLNEDGEMLFQFTPKLAEVAPEIFNAMLEELHEEVLFFWSEGFVELRGSLENPTVSLTTKAFDDSEIEKLSLIYQIKLKEFRSMFLY